MFEIGQHVIHPGQGVCTVTGFTEDVAHPMILLRAKSGHAETHLMYPLAQQSRLHAIISREDAEDLIDSYADLTVDSFTERNSANSELPRRCVLQRPCVTASQRRKPMERNRAATIPACSRRRAAARSKSSPSPSELTKTL